MIVIEFKIFPDKKHLFPSFQEILPMQELILNLLRKRFDFLTLADNTGVGNDEPSLRFQLQFNGICIEEEKWGKTLMLEN